MDPGNEMENQDGERCPLCGREGLPLTVHHLVPKDEGGKKHPTVLVCRGCHSQIHATFSNKELAISCSTLEAILGDERIQKYIRWARKRPLERKIRVRKKRSNDKNKRK